MIPALFGHIVKSVSDRMASQHVDNIHSSSLHPETKNEKVAELSDHIQRNFLPHFQAEQANLAGGGQELGKDFPIQDTVILAASHALQEHPDFHSEVTAHPVHGSEKWEGMGFDPEGAEYFSKQNYVSDLNRGLSKHFSTPESFGFPPKPNMQESYTTKREGKFMLSEEPNAFDDSAFPQTQFVKHNRIVDTVAREMVNMLYGHLDDENQKMHENEARNAMNTYAQRVNKAKPFESIQDAVDALHLYGHHHYDLESHDEHGIYSNFDIGGDVSERNDYESIKDKNEEIFNERLHDAVHDKLYPKNESYSSDRRIKSILETIQIIMEEDE